MKTKTIIFKTQDARRKTQDARRNSLTAKASHVARIILCLFWVALGLSASLAQAETFRYKYIDLNQAKFPTGISRFWMATSIDDNGRVYGIAYNDDNGGEYPIVYDRGVVTALGAGTQGDALAANGDGTAGGNVINFNSSGSPVYQAALFRGHKTKLIAPNLPGEVHSYVIGLNDEGTALIESYGDNPSGAWPFIGYSLYKKGRFTLLDFGPTFQLSPYHNIINNEGTLIGNVSGSNGCSRGLRYGSNNGKTMTLNPLPTGECSSASSINNRGNVLGVTSHLNFGEQHIGLWDKKGVFHTYLVDEGTPQFPSDINSIFNDNNLILITVTNPDTFDLNSYLLPKPGVRLNVADLVVNPPSLNWKLSYIMDINNKGDIIGSDKFFSHYFLLKRIDATTP
ncbi:MAG: hypothetical protein ABL933_06570 [Methyloglobulus sp.]|nr:hypothetical protein [Methyloglobulus sp.]